MQPRFRTGHHRPLAGLCLQLDCETEGPEVHVAVEHQLMWQRAGLLAQRAELQSAPLRRCRSVLPRRMALLQSCVVHCMLAPAALSALGLFAAEKLLGC